MPVKLFRIQQNGNRYCGPSVISALTGIGTKQASQAIRNINGRAMVKGTSERDVVKALSGLGVDAIRVTTERATLSRWSEKNAGAGNTFLVVAGHHWIIVQGQHAQCGKTIELVDVKNHPNARCFVASAYRLSLKYPVDSSSAVAQVIQFQQAKAAQKSAGEPAALRGNRKIVAMAAQHEIILNKQTDGSIKVMPPAWLEAEDDPYLRDHDCVNWSAASKRVSHYAEIVSECIRFDLAGVDLAKLNHDWEAIQHL